MSEPQTLLALARRMLGLKARKLGDAPARRAVSTAYYSLFHLLTDAATGLFVAGNSPCAPILRRTFNHGSMMEVSGMFGKGNLPKVFGKLELHVPESLRAVCKAFIELQVARESADYDSARPVRRERAAELVTTAERAFAQWDIVKGTDEARLYLACFLLQKDWNKPARNSSRERSDSYEDTDQ